MALVMTDGPVLEPVSLAEAKAHLRIDGAAEDLLVGALLTTARAHIETAYALALMTQSWALFVDRWPDSGVVHVPLSPFAALGAVRAHGVTGQITSLPDTAISVDPHARPARLVRTASLVLPPDLRPTNGIEIGFTAGFGAAPGDVPAPIRQAILLLTAHWFEHRIPDAGGDGTRLPAAIADLIAPWRPIRLA